MKKTNTILLLLLPCFLFGQMVNYTAKDTVSPYEGPFRPGINMGYHPNWTNIQLATIGAGDPTQGQLGAGAKAVRPGMFEYVFANFGYNLVLGDFQAYQDLGMTDITAIIDGPSAVHRDFTNYCAGQPSAVFKNLYLPIWDGGANGTPYNDDNHYAAYLWEVVNLYKDYVKFWEIWNEPGFDFTKMNGAKQPGQPGNWWDDDPNPCDYQLRAPIQSYVRILRISWEVVKTLDPDSYVVMGDAGYPSFMDAVLRNTDNNIADLSGALGTVTTDFPNKGGAYFDCVSYHAYPHFDYTSFDPVNNIFERHSDGGADGLVLAKQRFETVLFDHGFDGVTYPEKEWIVTEFNSPRTAITGPWMNGVAQQRNYMLKVLIKAKIADIAQMHVYELFDNRTQVEAVDEFDLMGLYGNDSGLLPYNQVPNPQAKAMKTFTDLLYETEFDASETLRMALPSGVRGYAFKKSNDEFIYALWAETQNDLQEAASANYTFPASLGLGLLNKYEWDYGYTNLVDTTSLTTLSLTETPLFFEKNTSGQCGLSATISNIQCLDNGTATNPSDDRFSFEISVTGSNAGAAWEANFNGKNYFEAYGQTIILDTFPIADGNLNFTLTDTANSACATSVFVGAPQPCSNPPATSYCLSSSDFPWHEWIANVKLGSIDKSSSKTPYSDFTVNNTSLIAGQQHEIELTAGYSWLTFKDHFRVWIDFDKDRYFEPNELVFEGKFDPAPPQGSTSAVLMGMIDLDENTPTGSTRMRVSMGRDNYPPACGLLPYGEVEDYTVTILPPTTTCTINAAVSNVQCTDNGTPNFGGDDRFSFDLTVNGTNTGSGWQSLGSTTTSGLYGTPKQFSGFSAVGTAVTFNIEDLDDTSCATTIQVAAPGPCSLGGGTGTYCASASEQPWVDWIAKIKVGDLEWVSSKSQYSDFLANTFTLETGKSQTVQLTTGFSWQDYDEYWRVWIDFDKDGQFEAEEMVVDSFHARPGFTTLLWSLNTSIFIPDTIQTGVTRMRIVMNREEAPSPCGVYTYGETEDFSVNIINGGGGGNCSIFGQISNLACQDAGTPSDPSDDTFAFNLLVNGANTGSGWTAIIVADTITGIYGQSKPCGMFPIAGGAVSIAVMDNADSQCTSTLTASPPATCSNQTGPCNASSQFPWHDWIAGVAINDLESPSGKSTFSDFTAKTYTASRGKTDTMTLTIGYSWFAYDEFVRVWIDFNQDGIYSPSEMVIQRKFDAPPNGTFSADFTETLHIDTSAKLGLTTMRVTMSRDTFTAACGIFENGEAEDYGVTIVQTLTRGIGQEDEFQIPDNQLVAYPNPVGETLSLSLGDWAKTDCQMTMLNQFGHAVLKLDFSKGSPATKRISMSHFSNGVYFLRFEAAGKRTEVQRIVVGRDY